MGAQPKVVPGRMTADEYLAWSPDGPPGRWELIDGEVVPQGSWEPVGGEGAGQAAERLAHVRVKGLAYAALLRAVAAQGPGCEALVDGAAVRIDASTVFEPDALVRCGPTPPGEAVIVPDPVIVVEVLSPSTRATDLGRKLDRDFALSSLWHYLILDPERRTLIHHRRGAGPGRTETRVLSPGEALALDPPGLALGVAEMFGEA